MILQTSASFAAIEVILTYFQIKFPIHFHILILLFDSTFINIFLIEFRLEVVWSVFNLTNPAGSDILKNGLNVSSFSIKSNIDEYSQASHSSTNLFHLFTSSVNTHNCFSTSGSNNVVSIPAALFFISSVQVEGIVSILDLAKSESILFNSETWSAVNEALK